MAKSKRSRACRWSAAQAGAVLERLDGSGLSVHRFALKHGVGVERLYRWRRRLGRSVEKPRFTELTIRPTEPAGSIEIERHGLTVRIAGESRVDDAIAILSRMP